MRNKYIYTFEMFNTENEAKNFADETNRKASVYIRRNKPASVSKWSSEDGKDLKYICFYYY